MNIDIIKILETSLVPGGTLPVVKLQLGNFGYYDYDKVKQCIEEIKRLPIKQALGEEVSELEKLAITLLIDSAHIDELKN